MFTINMKRPPFRAGLSCALTLGFALTAVSAQEPGNTIPGKDDQKTFHALKSSAESGDARAGYLLATLYRTGRGVAQDAYNAFHWCKLAAEEGVLEAQFQLGVMYLEGEGVTEDEGEAMKWLWLAADRGYPQATEVLEYVLYNDFSYGC